jgi:peptidoglycan hydrolase CwlO-like protein
MNRFYLTLLLTLTFCFLTSCVHYNVQGNLSSDKNSSTPCIEGSAKAKQQCRNEIEAVKKAISKS